MAKKKKKQENLPEGMSRRQAKLAARAAERAALEKDPRPFGGLAAEASLIALQEFAPSATAPLKVRGFDRDVYVATVLPGASAALIREDEFGGNAYVALQVQSHSHNPGRDLAFALNWVKNNKPGATLESTVADGTEPALSELLDKDATLDIEVYQDFSWWIPEGATTNAQVAQSMQAANDSVIEAHLVGESITGTAFWANAGGGKAYIRWVRPAEEETALLNALARVAARGELNLGEGTKFAGVFRTHGLIAPVFDLDPQVAFDSYEAELSRVDEALEKEIHNDAQLDSEERKQLENIKSRQVTLR
ncbi:MULTISPECIES: DUF5926 family protein [Corynebacterium]|uniref:DUF5926 family protein n=1 Tax=Corynebacterium TaxID=1716 RepID=UPI000EC52391|nr:MULTISPECIES: DUF5926 family protein [Corynebacterium]MDN6100557.1 DUF5926 family protein [Corynebacterium flavescens]MDN6227218.1 DUF5926 family protein [Corynebacterium flavescens]MDN6235520.1 DUF5926 family protein [Corynebacterium flavescens]MDN6460758.1 DUF5926 family protein [Corynebacterium flavescens]MDN6532551.1 DUF5926 family protein [Corynebacterium flavescens]